VGPLYQLLLWVSNTVCALQRTNIENSKQIFSEKELRGHFPNIYHVSVSDLYEYIPTIDLPILLQEILYVDRSWEYINRSQTHESGNLDWGRAIPRNGVHKGGFRCSVVRRLESSKSVLGHCVCEQLQVMERTQVPTHTQESNIGRWSLDEKILIKVGLLYKTLPWIKPHL
jgi:hypothetical protein